MGGDRALFEPSSTGSARADGQGPARKMFWGDIFGALIDRFGIGWQVNITAGNGS